MVNLMVNPTNPMCYICGRVRPNPPTGSDFDWREWEHDGEGWYSFASWGLSDKLYLCRGCARIVKRDINMRKEEMLRARMDIRKEE